MATRYTIFIACLLVAGAILEDAGAAPSFRPDAFGLSELLSTTLPDRPRFQQALARQGMLAVEMGDGFAELRASVFTATARCMDALGRERGAVATAELSDGTIRRTLAGESNLHGDKLKSIFSTASAPEECMEFEHHGNKFRMAVAEVVDAFGKRMSQAVESFGTRFPVPDLKYRGAGNTSSRDSRSPFADLTLDGPRLEHFHAYKRARGPFVEDKRMLSEHTIDFHADQGLFVVFSPGMMLPSAGQVASQSPTGRFTVRGADFEGNTVIRDLDIGPNEGSKLVILLGDAVRQLGIPHVEQLFHVPSHAFSMPSDSSSSHPQRLWYGLMQLPPPSLIAQEVMDQDTQQKLTFGEIRAHVAASTAAQGAAALGCSPLAQQQGTSGIPRRLVPRLLEDAATCESGSIYCWHRCMELPDMPEAQCEAKGAGFRFACISQFGQIYRPQDGHGDYFPACTNATEYVTPRPPVEQPSGESAASDQTWASLTALGAKFSHKILLGQPAGNTVLLWTLDSSSGNATFFHAKMLHRGNVGWMALGLENVDGEGNGMNGGRVVMGTNDPVLPQADGGPLQVGEYHIHPVMNAFRFWETPLEVSDPGSISLVSSSFSMDSGISILEFKTARIYNEPLNLSAPTTGGSDGNAVNRFIWALTESAYCTTEYGGYCAYHADASRDSQRREEFRGKVHLDLSTGDVLDKPHDTDGDHGEHDHGETSATEAAASSLASVAVAFLMAAQ